MTKSELVALDTALAKLQRYLDEQTPLHPGFETLAEARSVVEVQIARIDLREARGRE